MQIMRQVRGAGQSMKSYIMPMRSHNQTIRHHTGRWLAYAFGSDLICRNTTVQRLHTTRRVTISASHRDRFGEEATTTPLAWYYFATDRSGAQAQFSLPSGLM